MFAGTQRSGSRSISIWRLSWLGTLCAAYLGIVFFSSVRAQPNEPGHADGMVIGIANPITESAVAQIKNKIEDAFRAGRRIKTIIFDFNPGNGPASTVDSSPCLKLAEYLLTLKNKARTVAFVHDEVTGHTVLPVLACPTLIMSDKAALGDVLRGQQGEPLSETFRDIYRNYAKARTGSPDLIMKMIDKNIAIYTDGKRYLDQTKIKPAERERFTPVSGLQRGVSLFRAEEAAKCSLSQATKNTLEDVAQAEGLSEANLRQGILPGPKNAWLVELSGTLTRAKVNSAQRKIDKAIARGGNFFIIVLDCQGNDVIAARDFAEYLRNLRDDKGLQKVESVAFIPPGKKLDGPTAIALGCTEIVMAKDAVLGDLEGLMKGDDPKSLQMMRDSLVELAKAQRYPALLLAGTVDPDLTIDEVRSKVDPNYHTLISDEEFKEDQQANKSKWDFEKVVKRSGELLTLDGSRAFQYGVARQLIEDVDGVKSYYGLERVQQTSSDFLDQIQTFFQNQGVRYALVMIGIIGLILEMKMPGVGFPGVVAAICFVLFFWANSNVGDFTWLAILLFLLGLILIGMEVFFLPGVAVFGISGVVLVVASLVLVTLEKAPTTTHEWEQLGGSLATYTLTLIGSIVAAFVLVRYLPQIPYANRLVLMPPTDQAELTPDESMAGGADASAALLGAIGEAATTLRPAGKARFGDQYLDVVAEGSFVSAGKRVQVVEIEGNRVVVKEA